MAIFNHPILLGIGLLLLFMAAVEAGFRFTRLAATQVDDIRHEQIKAARDALGVLLSLLLGFTLAMALPRYDLRRQLVLEEANAISTASLRSQMLPTPYRENVRALLWNYTKSRLEFSATRLETREIEDSHARTRKLQSQLWKQADDLAQAHPTAITDLFITSLNDMFALSEKRFAAIENRIPQTIWTMLVAIGILTCLMFGYASRRHFWLTLFVTPLMITIVMSLIADLDSPRNGFIRLDLRSLQRVERDLAGSAPATDGTNPVAR